MDQVTLDRGVLAALRQLTMPGEPDVLHQVLLTFVDDVPRRLAALTEAAAAGRRDDAARAAHSLKGSAGNIGARRLQELAGHAEDAARRADPADLSAHAQAVRVEFERVEAAIRAVIEDSLRS
jgi:HPt (histidine-containing phosphotransfer) domain-containing protein